MPQFFVDANIEEGSEVVIRGADARHILKSLRLKAGDWIVLSDGEGRSFRATIVATSGTSLRARIGKEIERRLAAPPPELAISLIKGDRLEWTIEKAVELGVRRVQPFVSSRTIPRLARDACSKKVARWNDVALSAAKQSGLPWRPSVGAPIGFAELFRSIGEYGAAILLYEGERSVGLNDLFAKQASDKPSLIVVGPEGGFTDDEVSLARLSGASTASLGEQILRVETAAIAAIAIWQHAIGNMGCAGVESR